MDSAGAVRQSCFMKSLGTQASWMQALPAGPCSQDRPVVQDGCSISRNQVSISNNSKHLKFISEFSFFLQICFSSGSFHLGYFYRNAKEIWTEGHSQMFTFALFLSKSVTKFYKLCLHYVSTNPCLPLLRIVVLENNCDFYSDFRISLS